MISQNMPGAGHKIAANYVYNRTKPDGFRLIGSIVPSLCFDQLIGRPEVQYDWAKFVWIGSPVQGESQMYMRADTPYKTIDDVRNAKEPPRCGAQGTSDSAYYLPKLFDETLGTKLNLVTGYPGGPEIDLAVERGEIHCRAFTIEAFLFAGAVSHLAQEWLCPQYNSDRAQARCEADRNTTIWELMDRYKTPDASRRLATVVLAAGALGRPMLGTPGTPPDRVKILRDAFNATMKDPEFFADLEKRQYDLDPVPGEELEKIAKEAIGQTPDTIAKMKKLLGG